MLLDLLTVKFLISYSTRPLQIFGLLGIGMGLLTSDGRHVGYLTLLTHRAGVVPATAAVLLHAVNTLIADAVDRSHR